MGCPMAFSSNRSCCSVIKNMLVWLVFAFLLSSACTNEIQVDRVSGADRVSIQTGDALFRRWQCGTCHGPRGEGSPRGPSLHALGTYWNRDALSHYLAQPQSWLQHSPRLDSLARRYRPVAMPAFDALSAPERRALADFLLTLD